MSKNIHLKESISSKYFKKNLYKKDKIKLNGIVNNIFNLLDSKKDALQSATVVNAALLDNEDKLGQIKTGFYADIVASDANALDEIATLENITFVMKNGVVYKNK